MSLKQDNSRCRSYRYMTVANIRDTPDSDHVDVVFLESARFYRLDRGNSDFEKAIGVLRKALQKRELVRVGLESPDSDVICEIREQ